VYHQHQLVTIHDVSISRVSFKGFSTFSVMRKDLDLWKELVVQKNFEILLSVGLIEPLITGRPQKPPPPPRSASTEIERGHETGLAGIGRPSRPPPPKSSELIRRQRQPPSPPVAPSLPAPTTPTSPAEGSVYANLGKFFWLRIVNGVVLLGIFVIFGVDFSFQQLN